MSLLNNEHNLEIQSSVLGGVPSEMQNVPLWRHYTIKGTTMEKAGHRVITQTRMF